MIKKWQSLGPKQGFRGTFFRYEDEKTIAYQLLNKTTGQPKLYFRIHQWRRSIEPCPTPQ